MWRHLMNTIRKYLQECRETYALTEMEYITLLENIIDRINNNFVNLFDLVINICDREVQIILAKRESC